MSIRVNLRIDERWLALAYDLLQEQGHPARTNAQVVRLLFSTGLATLAPDYQHREPSSQGWLYATGGKATKMASHNPGIGHSQIASLTQEQATPPRTAEPRWHLLEDSTFKRRAQTLYQHHLSGTTSLEEDSQSEREDLAQVAEWLLGELRSQSSEATPE